MTNKIKFIEMVADYTNENEQIVSAVFEIVNKKDWKIFCSYMGDYDHPSERVSAENIFEKEIEDFCKTISEENFAAVKRDIDIIVKAIDESEFYHAKFHKMDEEFSEN